MLNAWFPVDGAILGGLGGGAQLEEVVSGRMPLEDLYCPGFFSVTLFSHLP
jgi:hypothetical protein